MVPLFGEISRIFSILLENISSMHFFPPQPKSFLQSPVDSLKPIKGGHFLKYGFCKKYLIKMNLWPGEHFCPPFFSRSVLIHISTAKYICDHFH